MGSYLMMLYVTVDQELALKSYFTQQGWPFKKPDLKVTTEELGGVVQNCLQNPEEPQIPGPTLQELPSNKRKAPQKQKLPAKVARQVLPTVDNNVSSNEVQDSVETSTAYEDVVAKVEKEDEVNEYHDATSGTMNNIVIEGEDFVVKEEQPDSNDESDNDTIDNDFDIPEESGIDSKVEPSEDIAETRALDQPGTSSEILVGASGQKESSIKSSLSSWMCLRPKFPSIEHTAAAIKSAPQHKKTQVKVMRDYRQRLKDNPELCKSYRESETLRLKLFRQDMSDEKNKKYREKAKERMRRYRERKKAEGNSKPKKTVRLTRDETEKQRTLWREQKKKQRENMTAQKKRRVNERKRMIYHQKKKALIASEVQTTSSAVPKTSSAIPSPSSAASTTSLAVSTTSSAVPLILSPKKKRRYHFFETAVDGIQTPFKVHNRRPV